MSKCVAAPSYRHLKGEVLSPGAIAEWTNFCSLPLLAHGNEPGVSYALSRLAFKLQLLSEADDVYRLQRDHALRQCPW